MSADGVTRWIPVAALAEYFAAPREQVRLELQQRHLLGVVGEVAHVAEEQAHGWAQRSYGAERADELLSDLGPAGFTVSLPTDEVDLVDESAATDLDWPYLL